LLTAFERGGRPELPTFHHRGLDELSAAHVDGHRAKALKQGLLEASQARDGT
jgi:hypothetical protein